MSRPSELRQLNDDELAQRLGESKEELFNLRFQLAMGKQDNSARHGPGPPRGGSCPHLAGRAQSGRPPSCGWLRGGQEGRQES